MAFSHFFAIFGPMKKWGITYFFVICAICFHANGSATPAKTIHTGNNSSTYTTELRTFTYKKALTALYNYPGRKDAGIFFQRSGIRILNIVVPYIAEPNFFISVTCHVPVEEMNTKEVERVLKDHLLHLFPSHYFW